MQGKKVPFFGFQMKSINMVTVFSIALVLCLLTVQAAPSPKRKVQQTRHCESKEACGWAIINAFTEIVDSFQNNLSCVCPPEKKCFKTEDFITYRCMEDGYYE